VVYVAMLVSHTRASEWQNPAETPIAGPGRGTRRMVDTGIMVPAWPLQRHQHARPPTHTPTGAHSAQTCMYGGVVLLLPSVAHIWGDRAEAGQGGHAHSLPGPATRQGRAPPRTNQTHGAVCTYPSLKPHAYTSPELWMATKWDSPAAMVVKAPREFDSRRGVYGKGMLMSPRACPKSVSPHMYRLPSVRGVGVGVGVGGRTRRVWTGLATPWAHRGTPVCATAQPRTRAPGQGDAHPACLPAGQHHGLHACLPAGQHHGLPACLPAGQHHGLHACLPAGQHHGLPAQGTHTRVRADAPTPIIPVASSLLATSLNLRLVAARPGGRRVLLGYVEVSSHVRHCWPSQLAPQPYSVPSIAMARLWYCRDMGGGAEGWGGGGVVGVGDGARRRW
jgi:hypothetical protein